MARALRRPPLRRESEPPRRRYVPVLLIAFVAAVLASGGAALLINIFERKQEARNPFYRVVDLNDETTDPALWGKNFPLQYDAYLRTVDQERTRFGGSEAVPRTPAQAAHASGMSVVELAKAQDFQRRAQFFLDFVEAENSMGFHAPQEAARIVGESINFSRQGQVAVRD